MITYDDYLAITGKKDCKSSYIDFLMDLENCTYDEAIEYIEYNHFFE